MYRQFKNPLVTRLVNSTRKAARQHIKEELKAIRRNHTNRHDRGIAESKALVEFCKQHNVSATTPLESCVLGVIIEGKYYNYENLEKYLIALDDEDEPLIDF